MTQDLINRETRRSTAEGVSIRPSSNQAINVMLVDSGTVIREGLRALLEQQPDLVVVAQAATVQSAGTINVTPDVIVTDIDLPDARHGAVISGLREFFPQTSILVLTLVGHPAEVETALAAGADGYVLKTATAADLLTGIHALAGGNTYLQPSLGIELARRHQPRERTFGLSAKEEQVLRLLALGHTNGEIARIHGVSIRTVETHRSRIRHKLGRQTRAELLKYAREARLVELDLS